MLLSIASMVLTRVIMERMKEALFKELRPEQAGFRFNKEQSIEWESPLYSTGMDFEKVYNSVDRTTIWKLMKHYLIPSKYISIIRILTCLTMPHVTESLMENSHIRLK